MEFYRLGQLLDYVTPEQKAMIDPYNDPAKLNFKFLIDFNSSSGLFASEDNVNSALAYLKRIGELTRYELLKTFIGQFKNIINNYEYLFMSVDGLDIIQNAKPYELFGGDSDKITLKMSEGTDFKIHGLLTTYRYIMYDDIRNVQVLPSNMQRFNCQVFVYNYGYYNGLLYDKNDNNSDNIEAVIFPTIKKVVENRFDEMNHLLFNISKCKFDVTESGKDFLGTVANNMDGDIVTNNITFGYKFAGIDGRYSNIMGEFNFGALMALDAVQKNHEAGIEAIDASNIELDEQRAEGQAKKDGGLFSFQKKQISQLKDHIKSRGKILANTLEHIKSDDFKKQMIQEFVDTTTDYAKNHPAIRNGLDKVHNLDTFIIGNGIEDTIRGLVGGTAKNLTAFAFDANDEPINLPPLPHSGNDNITVDNYNIYDGNL